MPKPFQPNDAYARLAKKEGFLARSAYKLKAILGKFPLLKTGDRVLDLGAAPGSWLQVISESVGPKGSVVGVDLNPPAFTRKNITLIEGDILEESTYNRIQELGPYNAVVSDMAPKTTGIKTRDQALSTALVEHTIHIAKEQLKPGGSLVAKIFENKDTHGVQREMNSLFKKVHLYKPPASRDRSFETYLIGIGKY